jgi:3-phenylpropionate/trans-cinnamate dioxygenase ferredoxin reductase subunit
MQGPIVIIGAGQAGLQVAESLRQEGYRGVITLLGDEAYAPYNRPPLSKKWLQERPSCRVSRSAAWSSLRASRLSCVPGPLSPHRSRRARSAASRW